MEYEWHNIDSYSGIFIYPWCGPPMWIYNYISAHITLHYYGFNEYTALISETSFMYMVSLCLSHTWVWYPGFSGHRIKCPILTTVVPGFSSDLIGCTIRSKWGPFGDLYLAMNNILCVWNKLFLGEIKFSQGELVLWSLYVDKLSLCRKKQMNWKI